MLSLQKNGLFIKKDNSRISAKDRARLSGKSDTLIVLSQELIDSFNGSADEMAILQELYKRYNEFIHLHNKGLLTDANFAEEINVVREGILEFFPYTAKVQEDKKLLAERTKLLVELNILPSKEEFAKLSEEDQNTRAANVNRILDLYDIVLTSKHHLTSTTRPLDSTKELVKTWADKVADAERNNQPPANDPLMALAPKIPS